MGTITLETAQKLDAGDDWTSVRKQFYVPEDTVYLDGNSLGLLSRSAEHIALELLTSWRQYAVDGWSRGPYPWFHLAERLGSMMASLVGADPHEVTVAGSTTSSLHQLVATFYRPSGDRCKIVADELAFPTDIYVLQSQLRLHGYDPEEALLRTGSQDGLTLSEDDLIAAMGPDVALVVLPSVLYRSGQLLNVASLTESAHQRGIPIGFDLSHSIGAIPHQLDEWGVDFAVWCTYKYLNGGPGAPAGLYVNRRHAQTLPALNGWFGSDKEAQFDMAHTFSPAEGAGRYQLGTPHLLSMAPLVGSLEMFEDVGIERIRRRSLALTQFLMDLADQGLADYGFRIGNPREPERRGGHVSLLHEDAVRITKAMKDRGVIPDFRPPDVLRLAPVALYTSFADIYEAVRRIRQIMEERVYEQYPSTRDVVS